MRSRGLGVYCIHLLIFSISQSQVLGWSSSCISPRLFLRTSPTPLDRCCGNVELEAWNILSRGDRMLTSIHYFANAASCDSELSKLAEIPDLMTSSAIQSNSLHFGLLKVAFIALFILQLGISKNFAHIATWIMLVGLPVYLCNTLPARVHPALGVRDYAAFGLFAGSFIFEIIADRQKSKWRRAKNLKQHDEEFISSGLWGISRHPKYSMRPAIYILAYRVMQLCW